MILAGTFICLFVLAGSAKAGDQKPEVVVDPTDNPLLISGVVGQDASFSAPLGLVEKNGVDVPISFVYSDLKSTEGDKKVSRDNVHVEGPATLPGGAETQYKVSVSGITDAGVYEGVIRVLQPGEHPLEGLVITLQVIARAEAVLNPVGNTENPQLKVINCKTVCLLTGLVPDVVDSDRFQLVFDNPSRGQFTITDATVVLQDTSSGNVLDESLVSFAKTPPFTLDGRPTERIDLIIHRDQIPAGHYTGYYSLQLEGAKDPLKSNLDLSVRDGPLVPLIIILVGVVFGRLVKRTQENRTGTVAGVPPADQAPQSSVGASMWRKILNWISGVRTRATRAGVRFAIWAVTLIVIVGIGFYNTYVKQGATFGANWIPDVIALLAFGLSAEVAGASLSALPPISDGPPPPAAG